VVKGKKEWWRGILSTKKVRSVGSLSYVMMCSSEAKQQSKKRRRDCNTSFRENDGGGVRERQLRGWDGGEKTVYVSFPENRSRIPTPCFHARINERNDKESVRCRKLNGGR
jgi:hypothetical protein